MIAAAYINLDRATERRQFMERQGERLGLALDRFSALSADDIDDARFEALAMRWERPLTRVEIALLMSHATLWQRAVDTNAPLAVFEDDAVLSHRLPGFLKQDLPAYDLINLEYFGRRKFFRRYGSTGEISDVARDKAGSAAYVVFPSGARKLLKALERHAAPSDAFIYTGGRVEIAQAEPALAIQAHILAKKGIDPGIETVTQIYKKRKPVPLERKTWFYGWRRSVTQLRLFPLHLGRGTFYELREARVDLSEFAQDQSSR